MRPFVAYILCLTLFLNTPFAAGESLPPQKTLFLSLEDAIRMTYERNLAIQIAHLDLSIKETDLDIDLARYDTEIEITSDHKIDESEGTSTVAGTQKDTTRLNFALTRLLKFGSTLAINFFNQREATNSAFVTLNPHYASDFEASLTQPLMENWAGLVDRSEVAITRIDIEQFGLDTQDKIEKTLAECAQTYWELVRAYEIVRIKMRGLQEAQRFLNINRERIQTGLIETPDLLAAEANVKQKELDVLLAENTLKSAAGDLRLLLTLEVPARIQPTESPAYDKTLTYLDQSLLAALAHRRDYLKAKKEIEEKKINLKMKKNERWPQLDLTATLTGNGLDPHTEDAVGEAFAVDNPTFFVGISAHFQLEGREEKAKLTRAGIEKTQAILAFQETEHAIINAVDDRVRNVNTSAVKVEKLIAIEGLQSQKLEEEKKKFSYGRSDSDTLIRFQNDALGATEASINAIIDYKQALVELARTENTLLSKYERLLNAYR